MNTKFKTWEELNDKLVNCRDCPRLVDWRERVAHEKKRAYTDWEYWGKPVPGFGDRQAELLIVGLAPGAHGSNRTGRMFTGDASGEFLYPALHEAGLASQPFSREQNDGLELNNAFISAVCRCAPPGNKPTGEEIGNCLHYLKAEMALLKNLKGIVALGNIAFLQLIQIYRNDLQVEMNEKPVFGHNRFYEFGSNVPWLLASYHPSRQNTQTGRLTKAMFAQVWERAGAKL
jgi:uracil-DNA glycosylase family 4